MYIFTLMFVHTLFFKIQQCNRNPKFLISNDQYKHPALLRITDLLFFWGNSNAKNNKVMHKTSIYPIISILDSLFFWFLCFIHEFCISRLQCLAFCFYICTVTCDISGSVAQPVHSLVYPTWPSRFGRALQGWWWWSSFQSRLYALPQQVHPG